MLPSAVTRPSTAPFVNQMLRSGPTAILIGDPVRLGIGYSVIVPSIVIRPTRLPSGLRPSICPASSTNHMLPSAPAVMSPGPEFGRGRSNSVILPWGVMRPILLALNSENQMLPSGPAASARGPESGVGIGNSVISPCGVIRPIFPPANSPNQMLPSLPSAIARGMLLGVGIANSAIEPSGEIRPIRLPVCSENHMLPSAPSAMILGELIADGNGYSLRPVPSGATRPIRLPPDSVNHTVPSFASARVVGPLPGLGSGHATGRPSVEVSRSFAPSQRCSAEADATATVIPRIHSHLRASIDTFPHPVLPARLCYISDLRCGYLIRVSAVHAVWSG